MTTARTIVEDAYIASGIKSPYEAIDAQEYQYALRRLNNMRDSNSIAPQLTQLAELIDTVGPGISFTVAPSGDFDTPAIGGVEHAFARIGNTDYDIELIGPDQYFSIYDKITANSYPEAAYYAAGVIKFYPALSGPTEIHLIVRAKGLFATIDSDVAMSAAEESAMILTLAESLCIGVRAVDNDLRLAAKNARDALRSANIRPGQLDMGGGTEFDIISGRHL